MKITPIRTHQKMANALEKFSTQGGEKIANYVNAAGKFAIAPLMILFNPFSNEPKHNREWAAIKQPVEAVLALGLQLISLKYLYKGIDKLAQRGKLTFKLVEEAKKTGILPKRIAQEAKKSNLSKEDTIKKFSDETIGIFKDRVGTLLTILLYIPTLAITNRIFPKIADRLVKDDD